MFIFFFNWDESLAEILEISQTYFSEKKVIPIKIKGDDNADI